MYLKMSHNGWGPHHKIVQGGSTTKPLKPMSKRMLRGREEGRRIYSPGPRRRIGPILSYLSTTSVFLQSEPLFWRRLLVRPWHLFCRQVIRFSRPCLKSARHSAPWYLWPDWARVVRVKAHQRAGRCCKCASKLRWWGLSCLAGRTLVFRPTMMMMVQM